MRSDSGICEDINGLIGKNDMQFTLFNVSVSKPEPDLTELNNFCARHAIESIDKPLIPDGKNSFWRA